MRIQKDLLLAVCLLGISSTAFAASTMATRPDDPRAVHLIAPEFGAHGDGIADDSAAIQAAIDQTRQGVVFVAPGRYRITRTIFVSPGVRLFGYGPTRPVFVLGPNTPGYQKGVGAMVLFTGRATGGGGFGGGRAGAPGAPAGAPAAGRGGPQAGAPGGAMGAGAPAGAAAGGRGGAQAGGRGGAPGGGFGGGRGAFRVPFPPLDVVPPNPNIADADQNTFYASMSNIDIEIGEGNPAAVAVHFRVAQHCFLSHMDFHLGSGLSGINGAGNEMEDLHFYGGRYGIMTEMTSPGWQFTLIDSEFQGQRDAAIREHDAGMTLIRNSFRDVPVGVEIDKDYFDQLWVKDCRFENIARAAVIISKEKSPLNEIGFQNAVLKNAPVFALFRDSGKKVAGKGPMYKVADFNFGLILPGPGKMGTIGTIYEATPLTAMPAAMAPAIPPLPPTSEWVNVHTLGVTGDGTTDDTAAIQKAIAQHRVLYFPSGRYKVTETLALKPDTALIGLHPTATQIILAESTPAFEGIGGPVALIAAPSGGTNIVSGLGVSTGNINPRAVGILWRAGEASLIDDVRIQGPGGGNAAWDLQYPSIWITQGGGGTFADIWTPNTNAQAGFYISDTKTPGHVYEISVEHHVRNEIKLDHVENWDINSPQTEEEQLDSPEALSLEIQWCKNITIANYHAYRVTRSRAPYRAAARVYNSSGIHFRNVHVNAEAGYPICDANGCATFERVSKYPFDNSIEDVTHHLVTREREFAVLDIPASPAKPLPASAVAVLEPGAAVRKLEDGFFSIAGAAVDAAGKLYFVDRHQQRIFGWSSSEGLTIERDSPLNPINLAIDKSGNLIILSSTGPEATVYTFKPGPQKDQLTVLSPQAAQPHPTARVILPVNFWNDGEFRSQLDFDTLEYKTLAKMFEEDVSAPKAREYVSPDGSVVLPAFRVFQQGAPNTPDGWRFSDTLDAYGFVSAKPGDRIYVSNSSEDVTYRALVKPDGSLGDLQPFAQRGGECVAADAKGNVYVANGQIFVYDPAGKQIGQIEVPERPLDIVFGGADGRTLFILTHHALFSVRVRG